MKQEKLSGSCSVKGKIKMQIDVDIQPTLRSPHMTNIDKQMDKSEGSFPLYMVVYMVVCYKHLTITM